MQNPEQKRDLVLLPGEYAYLQDETRGVVKTYVGPTVMTPSAQDRPVLYDPAQQTFSRCSLEQAVVKSAVASEGDYIVLDNPSADGQHPEEGQQRPLPALKTGRKVNIPGPCTFALWPGQRATVVKGHHLRSNQYLLVRVYNEQEARQNWGSAVAVLATESQAAVPVTANAEALNLTIGKILVIKGTEVSFYIPPTGVEVNAENNNYIRDAVTLENLEYSLLIDENGNKRYERGPQVVFPKPTETFFSENNNRKFKALDLNKIQGILVKVIADYSDNGVEHGVGDELFITGEDTPIYYPRVEHSIISYGEKQKHYATAIPAGEARYVMNRETGEIKTEKGPKMLLPDPRQYVIVRRVLSDKQVNLWYPNNQGEALAYNRNLRAAAAEAPSSRSGFISEGDVKKTQQLALKGGIYGAPASAGFTALADTFERGANYTQPRTLTLDTRYEGVPAIQVWTGYAVMVVSKTGTRRVVKGPSTILLDYDESLEVLELSTGKPKNTDNLQKTVYLRTVNNKVSDYVSIKTKDQVKISLKLSYRVNFEGDPAKWFEVENYVKLLCDHVRSVLKGQAQKRKVEEFSTEGVDIVRNIILGELTNNERSGMLFENGMRITDVEVLGIDVEDGEIAKLLSSAQHDVVGANIQLHKAEKELEVAKRKEEIARDKAEAEAVTQRRKNEIQTELINQTLTVNLARITAELVAAQKQEEANKAQEAVVNVACAATLQRKKDELEQELAFEQSRHDLFVAKLKEETEATVKRFTVAQDGFSQALLQIQGQETLIKIAEATSVQKIIGGQNMVDVLGKLFQGSPLEGLLAKVTERVQAPTPERRR